MSISEQIELIVKDLTDNNIPSELVTITKAYPHKTCDINTNKGSLRNVRCSGLAKVGDEALLVYEDGNSAKPFVLLFGEKGDIDLDDYYTKIETDAKIKEAVDEIDIDLTNYYNKSEINRVLSSYATIGYLNSNYAKIQHSHSQYIRRDEISDLDIDLTTLELVPYSDNPNGVICFEQVRSQGYYTKTETDSLLASKQDKLVSGTNIKTINNQSLLGNGNITIQGGGGSVIGTGSFSIDANGHLIVELPDGVDNPYYIDANGHLIYDTSV